MNQQHGAPGGPHRDSHGDERPDTAPWSLQQLADLRAGLLPGPQAERLRETLAQDPDAAAAFAALERTERDLAALGQQPVPAIPPELEAQLRRRYPAAQEPTAVAAPPRRRRVLAAAAAVAALLLLGGLAALVSSQPWRSETQQAPAALQLRQDELGSATQRALGRSDYGPLADPAVRQQCLAANGVAPGVRPLGARQVLLDGRQGVLFVLPGPEAGRFRLLVVAPGCATGSPMRMAGLVTAG